MPLQVPPLLRQLLRPQLYRGAKTYRVCGRSDRYHPPAIPHPFKCAAAAAQLYKECFGIPPQARPVGVRRLSHPPVYHTPKHNLWVFGRAITPPGLSHPHIYHTPKRTLWVVGRAITPPGLSHPLRAAATSTLSPGLYKTPHPPQDTTRGHNIFKRSNVSPGVCYLVWFTVRGMIFALGSYDGELCYRSDFYIFSVYPPRRRLCCSLQQTNWECLLLLGPADYVYLHCMFCYFSRLSRHLKVCSAFVWLLYKICES